MNSGRANLSMYAEISESEKSITERILNFFGSAPKYSGNPEKVFHSNGARVWKLTCLAMDRK